ncbi:hypothetical protein BU16DRAFT_538855 [Lophium mytilinum]|uniref:Uncharacterized protein n=1 Tax=Lophium mytilinum TaxID=390894 RepID=A0A6A6QWU8_9PEZI|nr:hypothetical protein BU16DRAFT_538855 [Lophium mytilinum]
MSAGQVGYFFSYQTMNRSVGEEVGHIYIHLRVTVRSSANPFRGTFRGDTPRSPKCFDTVTPDNLVHIVIVVDLIHRADTVVEDILSIETAKPTGFVRRALVAIQLAMIIGLEYLFYLHPRLVRRQAPNIVPMNLSSSFCRDISSLATLRYHD